MPTYLVGGAVRDKLLGLPVTDRDWVVVGSNPEQMLANGFKPVGQAFPVFLHPTSQEEYALARTEQKTGLGYQGFRFHYASDVTLADDLQRRDLTINAMAEDGKGQIIDPYGGQEDIKRKLLRHVSRAFVEDPVRVLRLARFAARFAELGFTVADETMQLMREMVAAGEVAALVPERIWQEMARALCESRAEVFWQVLAEAQALPVIWPEYDSLWPGEPDRVQLWQQLARAGAAHAAPEVLFALLFMNPRHTLPVADRLSGVQACCERWRVPKTFRELALLVTRTETRLKVIATYSSVAVVELLATVDAYRRPERFDFWLQACHLIHGEDESLAMLARLRSARKTCAEIRASQFVELGYKGKAIQNQLHQARIDALESKQNDFEQTDARIK